MQSVSAGGFPGPEASAGAGLLPRGGSARPVMVHAQLLGLDQLPRLKPLGMIPSFFAAHVYHWGEDHVRNFGWERASRISPAGSALALGIPFTLHQDSPVIRPDMIETLWCAANRRTRAGRVLGPAGQSGRATGPHLPFELLDGAVRRDPSALLGLPA